MARESYDIVIVGAGIAGGALAVALSGVGLSIALVEAQALVPAELPTGCEPTDFDNRVSALTPQSRNLLERLGAWDAIANYRYCPYRHMTVWDAQGTGQIEFDQAEVDAAQLGYIVENRVVVNALLEQIATAGDICSYSPVALESCTRLDNARMQLQLAGGEVLEADLLVAADGAQSRVRQMMDFATREWDYGHRAIVTTVRTANPHQETAWQRFLPTGPLALLPLPVETLCSIVWSLKDHLVDEMIALDDPAFCAELTRASEGRLGAVQECAPRFAFPLRQRHAIDYVQPGVALVADAAHTLHPLAGQGINLGLLDVDALACEVIAGHRRGLAPGQLSLLRRYQRQRKGENLLMMSAMEGFKQLFEQESLPLRWARNTGMRAVNRMAPLKQRLMRQAMGLG